MVKRQNLLDRDLATRRFVQRSSDRAVGSFTDGMKELVIFTNIELGERLGGFTGRHCSHQKPAGG